MILSRVYIRRASQISRPLAKSIRGASFRTSRRSIERRGYATAGEGGSHSTHKSSSDLPWAITSLVITVPSVWYLIQPQLKPKKSHGHGHDDGGHGEHVEKTEEGKESESSEHGAANSDDHEESGNIADEGGSNNAGNDESENTSDGGPTSEIGENVEGVQSKGATSGDNYGKTQGEASKPEQDPDDKDLAASSKPAGKAGESTTQSSKQEGVSNSDTKHSIDIKNDSEHSLKGEGIPETAKSKGTVDPRRPQK